MGFSHDIYWYTERWNKMKRWDEVALVRATCKEIGTVKKAKTSWFDKDSCCSGSAFHHGGPYFRMPELTEQAHRFLAAKRALEKTRNDKLDALRDGAVAAYDAEKAHQRDLWTAATAARRAEPGRGFWAYLGWSMFRDRYDASCRRGIKKAAKKRAYDAAEKIGKEYEEGLAELARKFLCEGMERRLMVLVL